MSRKLGYKVDEEKVFGPDEERGIAAGDWRDPDALLLLDGLRVYTRDETLPPDWSQGAYLMDNATGKTFDLGPNPLAVFRQAHDEGRVLYGVIIARDEQRHN